MKKQLTRLLIRTLILTAILVVADRLIGTWLEHMFYKQTHGDDYTTLYAITKTQDEVLIFGTSRASHHYNARLITELTGNSAFNAGRDEMEIPYTEAMLKTILPRHRPKVIILDIGPLELSGDKQVVYERISAVLLPFTGKYSLLYGPIAKAGNLELGKMLVSKTYRYNSKIGSIFQNAYTGLGHASDLGYEPLYKTIDTAVYKKSIWKDMDKNRPLDTTYLHTLNNIIEMAEVNDIKLAIVISPFYFYNDFTIHDSYNTLKEISARHPNISLLDFTNDMEFTGQPTLFYDDVHLNDSGAAIYTKKVVGQLKERGVFQ